MGKGEKGGRGEKKLMHDMQGLQLSLNLAELCLPAPLMDSSVTFFIYMGPIFLITETKTVSVP